jgi:hypothetical protein
MRALVIGAVIAASLLVGVATGSSKKEWPAEERAAFNAMCQVDAGKAGFPDRIGSEICGCIGTELEQSVPYDRLQQMREKKDVKGFQKELSKAADKCVDQVVERHKNEVEI